MSKFLVKMLGPWTLLDGAAVIHCHRPTVVEDSQFLQSRKDSQVKYLSELEDEATDEKFEKVWQEKSKDEAAAVEAFLTDFAVKKAPEETPQEKADREAREADALALAVKKGTMTNAITEDKIAAAPAPAKATAKAAAAAAAPTSTGPAA